MLDSDIKPLIFKGAEHYPATDRRLQYTLPPAAPVCSPVSSNRLRKIDKNAGYAAGSGSQAHEGNHQRRRPRQRQRPPAPAPRQRSAKNHRGAFLPSVLFLRQSPLVGIKNYSKFDVRWPRAFICAQLSKFLSNKLRELAPWNLRFPLFCPRGIGQTE